MEQTCLTNLMALQGAALEGLLGADLLGYQEAQAMVSQVLPVLALRAALLAAPWEVLAPLNMEVLLALFNAAAFLAPSNMEVLVPFTMEVLAWALTKKAPTRTPDLSNGRSLETRYVFYFKFLYSFLSSSLQSFGSPPPTLVFPPSPISADGSPTTPPGSVPGSPSLPRSPRSPVTPPDSGQEREDIPENKGKYFPQLPPLLRPRQIHPTKANKLGITKPVKKVSLGSERVEQGCLRVYANKYYRDATPSTSTADTAGLLRPLSGAEDPMAGNHILFILLPAFLLFLSLLLSSLTTSTLCNACGLYFSKMIKRETMVIPQGRRVAIDALLNPHS